MSRHRERHASGRGGWLRAAVLGSNDAIVSTSSLMMGVAAADASTKAVLVAGIAGLVAGSMSMAVGEYVSVGSQRDSERADIAKETEELATAPEAELKELTKIYQSRGLTHELAHEVAVQLTAHDPLVTHLRDELGIEEHLRARPIQAAWISALSFATFAMLPILAFLASPRSASMIVIAATSVVALAGLGAFGAYLGGAPLWRPALRVTVGGSLAMALTAAIGRLLGVVTG
jgi:vacuolar iron transporter family protein